MTGKEMNGGTEVEELEETSSQSVHAPELSARMKHLLFGVRLSVASAPLEAAGDLEELARRLDAMRSNTRGRDRYSS